MNMNKNFEDRSKEELVEEILRLRAENQQLQSGCEVYANERVLAKNKFQMLFEQSPVGFALVLHETGEFLEVNNAILESTGYSKEEFLQLSYWDLTPKEYEAQEIQQLETLNKTGRFGPNFKEYIRKDGSRYPISISGALFVDVDGRNVVWGIIEDLSERRESELIIKKQNEELRQLNAAKDKFFSIIAHDLKNPFSAIIGLSEILLERIEQKDIESIDRYAGFIHQSSQKALNLLMNLLEWSQVQTGMMKFNPEYFKLHDLMQEILELLVCNATQKNIRIDNHISEDTVVFADKNMISTVIRNLTSNAIKYTPLNGQIQLSAQPLENEVVFVISDNGIGISPQESELLFKIDGVHSRPGTQMERGTGLGLILCKDFVLKNNGEIWMESTEDVGSTFFFSLPIKGQEVQNVDR